MMKRIFMLLALALMLVAAMALSGVAQAKTISLSPKAECQQEAASLGVDLTGYTFVYGDKKKNDVFTDTVGQREVFCGFGGDDSIITLAEDTDEPYQRFNDLEAGDIFIGGDGNDSVNDSAGIFNGGAGNDTVSRNYGTFNGGAGDDLVGENYGPFNGGDGNDTIDSNFGTFHGGDGIDAVYTLPHGGTFYGEAGDDLVGNLSGGTFNGGDGIDHVITFYHGTFNGGDGLDTVGNFHRGTFNQDAL